jgi:hypothetical protein
MATTVTLEQWMKYVEDVVVSSMNLVYLTQIGKIQNFAAAIVRDHPLLNCSGRVEKHLQAVCRKTWEDARKDLIKCLMQEKKVLRVLYTAALLPGDVQLKKRITIRFFGIYRACIREHEVFYRKTIKDFAALGIRGIRELLKISSARVLC